MKSLDKKVRQQMATLGARQGDPEAPASGTLYARLHRLRVELEQIETGDPVVSSGYAASPFRGGTDLLSGVVSSRSAAAVRRDIVSVEAEIESVQKRIDELDRLLTSTGRKGRC